MNSAPTPPKLRKAKAAAVTAGAIGVTAALTFGGAGLAAEAVLADRNEVTVSNQLSQEEIDLLASIGIYPIGPGAQIARLFGAGTPQGALRTLGLFAGLIPGEAGVSLRATLQTIAAAFEAAQVGLEILPEDTLPDIPAIDILPGGEIDLNLLALRIRLASQSGIKLPALDLSEGLTLAFPEIAVPGFGPAGTYDAVAGLDGDLSTQLILTLLKTLQSNTDQIPSDLLPPELDGIIDLVKAVPLNVPADRSDLSIEVSALLDLIPILDIDLELLFSTATKLAVLPSFGLGGTNIAITAPYFLKEDKFADTVVLAIPIRNTSRPGGGIMALLNPLSSLAGINLSNVDGREGNGNVTFWDITAAYDLLSDAPSTVLNPVAWANAATGALMPTYLVPQNVETLAGIVEDIASGDISLDTIFELLAAGSITELFHTELGEDGNLYITYDSGNLPLLEPFQFLPRTVSYLPGFDISTPFSESFNDALTQLVAMGYQDVAVETADGIPSFVRQWDKAGTQAKFWTNPVSFEDGLQAPQALFNALIGDGISTGITGNLLNPEAQQLKLFGSDAIGDAVYRNALSVAVAGFLRDALLELKDQLNPLFDAVDSNDLVVSLARGLDDAVAEINGVIDQGGEAIKGLGINLSDPLMDGNRAFNDLTGSLTLDNVAAASEGDSAPDISPFSARGASGENDAVEPKAVESVESTPKLEAVEEQAPENAPALTDLAPETDLLQDKDLEKSAKSVAASLKEQRQQARAELREAGNEIRSNIKEARSELRNQVKEARSEIRSQVKETRDNVRSELKKAGESVQKSLSGKSKSQTTTNGSSDNDGDSGKNKTKDNDKPDAA